MKSNIKIHLITLFIFFGFLNNLYSNSLTITGLSKLSINDLQTQTSIDLDKKFYSDDDINTLLKDLYKSELIFDLKYNKQIDTHFLEITENLLIKEIYINGNQRIEEEIIIKNISMKKNGFINKNQINDDIDLIKSIYRVKGFNNATVTVSTEKFSSDKVNLIFYIKENDQSQIERITFNGNQNFSDRYLLSLVNTKTRNFYNIFTTGSNLNIENFAFDINKIKSFYKQKGFFDVKVNYNISETSSNKFTVNFFIEEGNRLKLDDVNIDVASSNIPTQINKQFERFTKKLSKNNFYYDQPLIDEYLNKINKLLINNNDFNNIYVTTLDTKTETNKLTFITKKISPSIINKINITGNVITKDSTIRSKIPFEPGDYFNSNLIKSTKNDLLKFAYINSANITSEINDGKSDINVKINENKKTGQVLFGGSFSGDSGAGLTLSLKDNNIFGSGNKIDTNFTANQENTLFQISYIQFPVSTPNIRNSYSIFNTEKDLTNSFGFKNKEQGIGYSLKFDYDETFRVSSGFSLKKSERYSAKTNTKSINENIGDYNIYSLNLSLKQDTTNNILYPTNGLSNSIFFEYSPKDISDDSYYKFIIKSDVYRQSKNSNRFLFFSNDFGLAESLEGNLSTVNAFSLGGLNFKGFDYRGIGPKVDGIYLGGNKFFTSTVGYGGSFLFDDKDNVNTKLFYSFGSIWDSDYTNDNDFDIRSSAGISFDILTAVGPISLSYAIPIDKNSNDRTSNFNFSIGTSF